MSEDAKMNLSGSYFIALQHTDSEVDVHTLATDYATNLASCAVQQNAMNLVH